ASLYLAPPSGKPGEALAAYFDWQMHLRAQSALAAWEILYRSGLVNTRMTPAERDESVLRTLGYVPSCADGSAFECSQARGEVRNKWHGSLSEPRFRARLEADAMLAKLVGQLRSVRGDIRFQDDGVHTTLTIDRAARK